MHIRIGLEKYPQGRTLAFALDYPGCFAYGDDDAEVMIRLPLALLKHEIWIKDHTDEPWIQLDEMDFSVEEVFNVHYMDAHLRPALEGYEVNAFFRDDWHVLTSEEIQQALLIFRWQREELLAGISTLSNEIYERQYPDQRWSILGILKHIANAENWYLDRLDYETISKEDMPSDPIERLDKMQSLIESTLPLFDNNDKVIGKQGEIWSCRKIIRRILWHQRDHIEHIKQLVFRKD